MYNAIEVPEELKTAAISCSEANFCILEDMNTKNYVIFDIKKGWSYMVLPFGSLLSEVVNGFIDSDNTAVHHETNSHFYPEELQKSMNNCKPIINELLSEIMSMERFEKYPDKEALKCAYIRDWKKFRYITRPDILSSYADYFSSTASEDEEKELKELTDDMHLCISKYHFIPYDVVYARCQDGWFHGMAWFASNADYLFSRELYHLWVDNELEQPHICPRCNHFYYSNNNKSKYCPDCKDDYSNIRKEYRQKNQARYIHKRINDRLHSKRFSELELNKFMMESNYYWDMLQERTPQTKPESWYKDIKTEEEYQSWLESKLQEYSARK